MSRCRRRRRRRCRRRRRELLNTFNFFSKPAERIDFIFGMEVGYDEMVQICSFGDDGPFDLATRWR